MNLSIVQHTVNYILHFNDALCAVCLIFISFSLLLVFENSNYEYWSLREATKSHFKVLLSSHRRQHIHKRPTRKSESSQRKHGRLSLISGCVLCIYILMFSITWKKVTARLLASLLHAAVPVRSMTWHAQQPVAVEPLAINVDYF